MSAEIEQHEGVVGILGVAPRQRLIGGRPGGTVGHGADRRCLLTPASRALGTQHVGEAAGGHRDQPGTRIVGHPVLRPLRGCRDERLLHRVLGEVEVPEPSHDGAEHLRREPPQLLAASVIRRGAQLSSSRDSTIGRTSA
jgi:hypothetical protein